LIIVVSIIGLATAAIREGEILEGRQAATLDRVHAATLQANGHANALRTRAPKPSQGEGKVLCSWPTPFPPRQAGSEEKRLVDAMLLAASR
jgi:hypothetical protein